MVFPYKKILVPYDGSKPSENALQQAIQLADFLFSRGTNTENIQIILLHIVEEIHIRIPNLYFGLRILAGKPMKKFFEEVYEDMKNESLKMLDDTKKRIESSIPVNNNNKKKDRTIVSISVNPQVVIGNPAEVIIDIANNKEKVDLIIMGSTSLKGISKVRVLGSVSRAVSENANCPVMLVH
jgi:nucleotide-binding universal stress UspA family protein